MELTKKNTFFSTLYIVIFILTMFSGSTFLSDIVMHLATILTVILIFAAKIKGFEKFAFTFKGENSLRTLFMLIIMFFIYQLRYSFNASTTLVFVERFIVYFFLIVFIPKMVVTYKTLKCIRIYSLIVAISIILTTIISGSQSGGLVGNYQFAGMMMSISFGLFIIDFNFEKGKLNVFGLILTFIALLCSGKRMFSFLALFSYLLVFLLTYKQKKIGKFLVLTVFLLIVLVAAYVFVPSVRLLTDRITQFQEDTTYNGRIYFWNAAIDIYNSHKLTGVGMGTFSKYFDMYYHRLGNMEAYDAHNIYIQMLAEIGIIGEGLVISFFALSLIKTIKLYRKNKGEIIKEKSYILLYSIYIQSWFIIYGLTGNPIYGASQFFFYITAVAMMLSVKYDKSKLE